MPKANEIEAAVVANLEIIGVKSLKEVVDYLNRNIEIKKQKVDIVKIFNRKNKNKDNIVFLK